MFTRQLSPTALAQWCRALAHGVDIGLPVPKLFRQQAASGPPAARPLAAAIAARLDKRASLADALAPDRDRFPPMFLDLVTVGEESGRLTEALYALEDHFTQAAAANRLFLAALVWPAFMLVSAVFVVAGMLLVLGLIAPTGGKPFDPIGLGLTGPGGAVVWLAGCFAAIGAVVATVQYLRGSAAVRAQVEARALAVPGLGGCFRAFALHRFSVGLAMTSEAGMSADRSLALSLRATGNKAYTAQTARAAKQLRAGRGIEETLRGCPPGLFPAEFLDAVEVGETGGRLAEVMARQAASYRDEATRRTRQLAAAAGGLVYAGVGLMVIVLIFRMAMAVGGVYDDALKGL